MSFAAEILAAAERVVDVGRARGWRIGAAESCTGGLVMAALTEIPGASDVVAAGMVTYSDKAKIELLGVDGDVIKKQGAVSEAVAKLMAKYALEGIGLDLVVAVTGIAGPGGGSAEKPVGLVHFATAYRGEENVIVRHEEKRFGDLGRDQVRMQAVLTALLMLQVAAK